MRIVIATCTATYTGRLSAYLPLARRLIVLKADGSVLLHSDGGSYKPLNWMSPPCTLVEMEPSQEQCDTGVTAVWRIKATKTDDQLFIALHEISSDSSYDLGLDPGLVKDGVEAHLQALLAAQLDVLGPGHTLVRREYPTAIGPVDIVARDRQGRTIVIEVKRRGEIDGVEQLTRYVELLRRDPLLGEVKGVFAAQEIKPQARVLATDRGLSCLVLDYDAMRGVDDPSARLF